MNKVVNIIQVEYVGEYKLHIVFDDTTEQSIDFKPFLSESLHQDIRKWLDKEKFKQFRLEYGELLWGDHELCFPMYDLYTNNIRHESSTKKAV
jgi:hypothetical protein